MGQTHREDRREGEKERERAREKEAKKIVDFDGGSVRMSD